MARSGPKELRPPFWTASFRSAGLLAGIFWTATLCLPLLAQDKLPDVVVDHDDFEITKSCRIVGVAKICDANGDGVIHIKGSGVTVEFAPGVQLQGLPAGPPDMLTGIGIRIDGQKNVFLVYPRIRGFKVGIYATKADDLIINGADITDMFRQHLRSTPAAEDGADWLWPHDNDHHEWVTKYGAAICVEDSKKIVIGQSSGRRGQNGIILDRVEGARITDNDFSFLSGWGLGLWRSNDNMVSRNAFDFCVRGYSHGVYNRGQDSAGILMFEQCSKNVFVDNSATHGGDCVFGFAGKEALGDAPPPSRDFSYARRGCNDNVFERNDFSYAPAHGIEMTFSFGNRIRSNRLVGNAICGIWGGYSQGTSIVDNEIGENGDMGYGLERGGVNIEHGFENFITRNRFAHNRCGVHLWWADNKDFPKKPWGAANYHGCRDNAIVANAFEQDRVAIHLRAAAATTVSKNTMNRVEKEIDADKASSIKDADASFEDWLPFPGLGKARPVGRRAHLRGRENIIMTEWGPWDHESPLVRLASSKGAERIYEVRELVKPAIIKVEGDVTTRLDLDSKPPIVQVVAKNPGVTSYKFSVTHNPEGKAEAFPVAGTIVSTKWNVRFFPTSAKPHEHPEAWARDSARTDFSAQLDELDFRFGVGGPAEVLGKYGVSDSRGTLGPDNFGLVAETKMPLRKGKWRITVLSDDGIRITADGKKVIDRWTWHAPTKDTAVLDLTEDRTIPLKVEYFELDGFAVLSLTIEEVLDSK